MLSRTVDRIEQSPWARLVWAVVGALALLQVAVLYQLCVEQVAKAQARESMVMLQRNAQAVCLSYMDGSTIASCARQAARAADPAGRDMPVIRANHTGLLNGAVPVTYVFH